MWFPASEVKQLKSQIRELERLLGKKTMETDILRDAIRIAREKKTSVADALAQEGRFPVKRITDTLGVSRSNVYAKRESAPRRRYRKTEDDILLPLTREIADVRPTYGYPRIAALMNRRLTELGRPRVNRKRVYRIMKGNHLLLPKHSGRPVRTHDGLIVTLTSNMRWCSDVFEIGCWNGERVRVAFSMDCHNREIISYIATTAGISGEMVRDLMRRASMLGSAWWTLILIGSSGSATTVPPILRMKRGSSLPAWDCCRARHRCRVPRVTGWPRGS